MLFLTGHGKTQGMSGTTPYNGLGCSTLVVNDRCHESQPSPIVTLYLLLGAGKVFIIFLLYFY